MSDRLYALLEALAHLDLIDPEPSGLGSPSVELFSDGHGLIRGRDSELLAEFDTIDEAIAKVTALAALIPPLKFGSYRVARGAMPYDPQQPKPETLIRRMRDAW